MATLARTSPSRASDWIEGQFLRANGWFTRETNSNDLWLDLGAERLRVNLDDFGPRREAVCERLLVADETRAFVFGVLTESEINVAAEFLRPDGRFDHGYAEVIYGGTSVRFSASPFQQDQVVSEVNVRDLSVAPNVPRLVNVPPERLDLLREVITYFERDKPLGLRRFKAAGRIDETASQLNVDALYVRLVDRPHLKGTLHVALVTGEVTSSPNGLYLVTPRGTRLRLTPGPGLPAGLRAAATLDLDQNLLYQTITVMGLWSEDAADEIRVFGGE